MWTRMMIDSTFNLTSGLPADLENLKIWALDLENLEFGRNNLKWPQIEDLWPRIYTIPMHPHYFWVLRTQWSKTGATTRHFCWISCHTATFLSRSRYSLSFLYTPHQLVIHAWGAGRTSKYCTLLQYSPVYCNFSSGNDLKFDW